MPNLQRNRKLFSLKNLCLIAEFEFRGFLRNKGDILRQLFYEPILYVLIFSNALSGLVGGEVLYHGQHMKYISFTYPGIIGLQLLRIFSQSIYRFTVDSRWGMQSLKISAGTGCLAYGLGTLVMPLSVFCIQSSVSYLVFRSIGGNISVFNFFTMLSFGFFCVAFWHIMAIYLSFCFKSYAKRDLFLNLTILPMTLTAPVFYSLELVPKYIALLAKINPLAYQVEFLRTLFLGKASITWIFAYILFIILLFLGAIFKIYRSEFYQAQN